MNIAKVDYRECKCQKMNCHPNRSVVEGPAVPWTSIQFDRKSRLFIGSISTCLRQVEDAMDNVCEISLLPSPQVEAPPSPLSSRAEPRDLQFSGPFLEMFFDAR
jgi:hypothetical protein